MAIEFAHALFVSCTAKRRTKFANNSSRTRVADQRRQIFTAAHEVARSAALCLHCRQRRAALSALPALAVHDAEGNAGARRDA
jgi:hypothetical protein